MLRTVSTSGRHVGLLVHVPVAASVVHEHGPLTIANAIQGGGQTQYEPATPGDSAAHFNRSVCGTSGRTTVNSVGTSLRRSGRVPTAIVDSMAGMAIARLPLIAIDCPDPGALARFYGAMLDWKIDDSTNPASVCSENGQCISFHQVAGYTPPTWPTQERPQQMHLDMLVDDLDAAEAAVIELGATKHPDQPGTSFRVFLDPAGHPFCLCLN